ncbi:MULE domain-containing protein [Aphis craccivora]|uniref:MULE domain-containing protein n=1 Tax=Aphis craccivora TaxID=307492 RepID=A0A6G0YLD7_APHCR|nr:MULE domain-containing protein [Aphis craccivora]
MTQAKFENGCVMFLGYYSLIMNPNEVGNIYVFTLGATMPPENEKLLVELSSPRKKLKRFIQIAIVWSELPPETPPLNKLSYYSYYTSILILFSSHTIQESMFSSL